MFVTEDVDVLGGALVRYRDAIVGAFDLQDLEELYSDLFGVSLDHEVHVGADRPTLVKQLLDSCANQGAPLARLLTRIVRVRAARRELVDRLAPALNLSPVVELADLLVTRGCPERLREPAAGAFAAAAGVERRSYHTTGRAAWIDVLVWLEELGGGGHARPPLLDYLERVERAWRSTAAAGAAVLAARLDQLRADHGIAARADDPPGRPRNGAPGAPDAGTAPCAAEPAPPQPAAAPGATCALPIALVAARHAPVLGTDAGEWFAIGADGQLAALPATGPFSAVLVDASGIATVACWDASIKQLRGTAWTEHLVAAPPVALALSEHGVVAGDAAGAVALAFPAARFPVAELAATASVLELGVAGAALVVLDSSGLLATAQWPGGTTAGLAPIDTAALGRPFALCPGIRAATLIAIGERGIAVVDGAQLGRVVVAPGIREVTAFRGHDRACVVTDTGTGWIVDGTLARVTSLRGLGGPAGAGIAGTAAGPDGSVLAWTTDGDLHSVGPDGSVRRLLKGDVVLAAAEPGEPAGYIAVHWTPDGGPRVSRGRAAWS
jgi:hypothetical protein